MTSRTVRSAYSKVSVKSQTVLPAEVRERLNIRPGDRLRYLLTQDGIQIEKAPTEGEDPFVSFTEWSGQADEEDYADL